MTLRTVIAGYTPDGRRVPLSGCAAELLTHLLNFGPSSRRALIIRCRGYAPGTVQVMLSRLRQYRLVAPYRRGYWRAV
jgi:hypothetical protein